MHIDEKDNKNFENWVPEKKRADRIKAWNMEILLINVAAIDRGR